MLLLRRPMKVDPKNAVTQVVAAKAQPFKQLLAEAKSELKKPAPVAPTPTKATPLALVALKKTTTTARSQTVTMQAPAQALQRARVHADSEAQRLGTVRSEHSHAAHSLQQVRAEKTEAVLERGEARVLELIVKELQVDAPPANRQPAPDVLPQQPIAASNGTPPKVEATPEAKAAQAVALIEKIERFVKSQRPGLALTLNNSLGAHVEIERMGPKEIALKLVGKNGPPSPEAVSRIRDELRARGLRIGALSVG